RVTGRRRTQTPPGTTPRLGPRFETGPRLTAVPQRIAGYTTLRLGGDARRLVVAHDRDELVQAVREAGDPRLVLAGGSNVLVGDAGFDGTVILIRSSGVRIANDGEGVLVTVE